MSKEKKFDPTKPVQTIVGSPVRILCTDRKGYFPIVGLVFSEPEDVGALYSWTAEGKYDGGRGSSPMDLINVPRKGTFYVNVYDERGDLAAVAHRSKARADSAAHGSANRVGRVRVELEEGVWDE